MQVYEALVKGLEDVGVEVAFGGNGENIASLALALDRSRQIRPIITRHEQAAAYMACGYAMFTDRLGVCFATVGPGAFNLLTGLGVAMSDSYPVLAITGYVAEEWQGHGAVNDTSGRNGTPDSRAIFSATTKRSFRMTDIAETWDVVEQAVDLALGGRPGPVHIEVPQNLTYRSADLDERRPVRVSASPVEPDPAGVEAITNALAVALAAGRNVVLLAGYGAVRSHAEAAVLRFAERFEVPVVSTLDGKGIIAESHRLAAGVFSESGHASAWKVFREADVVLAVGNSLNQHATFGLREDLFDGKVLIQVNIAEFEIGKHYRVDLGLVSDARLALETITAGLETRVGDLPRAEIEARDYETRRILALPGKVHPGRLAQAIGRQLPEDAVLLADAGAHLAWLGYYVDLERGQNFRKCGAFGPMAAHTNAAIGVKLASPERTVVVGCGDGCYAMSGFELMTAVQHDVPVIWVIFNDAEFKLVKVYQVATYGKSALVDLEPPDFAAYAVACGADGFRVETLDEFDAVFEQALRSGRPTVIDVQITRWALPHYSSSPEGVLHGAWEELEQRLKEQL